MNPSNWSVEVASSNLEQLHFNVFPRPMCLIEFIQTCVIIAEQYETPFDHNQ